MPIDIATGHVELDREDFSLPGRVPIKWVRSFQNNLVDEPIGSLGRGWIGSWFATLKRVGKDWKFTSRDGELHVFPDPDNAVVFGRVIRLPGGYVELSRRDGRIIVTEWDVDTGEIENFVFALGQVDNAIALIAVENVYGDGVDLEWAPTGQLKSLHQRTENRTITVNYSSQGKISSLGIVGSTYGQIELVRYEHDRAGHLMAAINRKGLANRYEYDARSKITRESLADGAVYTYKYDDKGRCVRFTGTDRYNEKRLQFLEPVGTTIVTNSYGSVTVYKSLPSGQITSETLPNGSKRETIYDDFGRIVARLDENGAATRFTYDALGNRDSITDPLGNVTRVTFNEHHQPTSLTDATGQIWQRKYDMNKRLVSTQNPLGARWRIDYDRSGNPVTITDPQEFVRRQRFEQGMLRESTDWMDHTTTFEWDDLGRVTRRIGPVGDCTVFKYDANGNPVKIELADGGHLQATYDAGDNLSSFTNAKGHSIRYRYGACRRLLERVDAIGRTVRFVWGTEPEHLDAVFNEKGEKFSFIRDNQGRVTREHSFDERDHRFEYDAAGRCIGFVNGNGERIQFKRDLLGRLIEKVLPDGAQTQIEYDPIGRIVNAVNPDAEIKFEYDAAGRLTHETQNENWVHTDYNLADEVIRTQTSLGHEVCYELDPNGRMFKLTTGDDQVMTFGRDARGLETGRQMPGGMRLEQRFDSMGRLLVQQVTNSLRPGDLDPTPKGQSRSLPGHQVIKRDYSYDPDGLLVSIQDSRWGATNYSYDPAERLLSTLRDQGFNEIFEYDVTDNLLSTQQVSGASDKEIQYGPGNRLLFSRDTRYEYDPEGRLVRKTELANSDQPAVWEYAWDAHGQLRQLRRPDGANWEYKYDAFGRRIAKLGANYSKRFVWNGDLIIHEIQDEARSVAWVMKQGSFAPLARVRNGELHAIITDHLGTPRDMLDSSGKVIWSAVFTAWGQIEQKLDSLPQHECPIRFQGQWFDEESGLHYNRFRYYDPKDARFIGPDPIGLAGGRNLYQYTNNPVLWIDPFGLSECDDLKSKEDLANQLRGEERAGVSEQQLAQVNQGLGTPIAGAGTATPLRDAPRLAAQHGGNPGDWSKVKSDSSSVSGVQKPGGGNFETHAYENKPLGIVVEPKTKVEGH